LYSDSISQANVDSRTALDSSGVDSPTADTRNPQVQKQVAGFGIGSMTEGTLLTSNPKEEEKKASDNEIIINYLIKIQDGAIIDYGAIADELQFYVDKGRISEKQVETLIDLIQKKLDDKNKKLDDKNKKLDDKNKKLDDKNKKLDSDHEFYEEVSKILGSTQ
jgi:hypothetical protein